MRYCCVSLGLSLGLGLGLSTGAIASDVNQSQSQSQNQTPRKVALMSLPLQIPLHRNPAPSVTPSPAKLVPLARPIALPPSATTAPKSATFTKSVPASKAVLPPIKKSAPTPADFHPLPPAENKGKAEDVWQGLYDKGETLYHEGKYKEAYAVWKQSLASADREKVWIKLSGLQQIDALKKLAMMHKTQGEPVQAVANYDQALLTAIKCTGPSSQLVADLMLEQGRMYTFNDKTANYARANEMLSESFRINEKLHGRFTIPTGDVAMAIAQLKEKENKFSEALSYWQLVIDIGDKLEPNDISCCRIGPRQGKIRCLDALGKFDAAMNAHNDLIAMCRKGAPYMMQTVLSSYATFLLKTGRASEAKVVTDELSRLGK